MVTKIADELLPVPYSHVIFTLPNALSPLALHNAKLIYHLLFRCVAETLLILARDPHRLGAELGFSRCFTRGVSTVSSSRPVSRLIALVGHPAANDSSSPLKSSPNCSGEKFLAELAAAFRRNRLRLGRFNRCSGPKLSTASRAP
jgi:hypothetical protein